MRSRAGRRPRTGPAGRPGRRRSRRAAGPPAARCRAAPEPAASQRLDVGADVGQPGVRAERHPYRLAVLDVGRHRRDHRPRRPAGVGPGRGDEPGDGLGQRAAGGASAGAGAAGAGAASPAAARVPGHGPLDQGVAEVEHQRRGRPGRRDVRRADQRQVARVGPDRHPARPARPARRRGPATSSPNAPPDSPPPSQTVRVAGPAVPPAGVPLRPEGAVAGPQRRQQPAQPGPELLGSPRTPPAPARPGTGPGTTAAAGPAAARPRRQLRQRRRGEQARASCPSSRARLIDATGSSRQGSSAVAPAAPSCRASRGGPPGRAARRRSASPARCRSRRARSQSAWCGGLHALGGDGQPERVAEVDEAGGEVLVQRVAVRARRRR